MAGRECEVFRRKCWNATHYHGTWSHNDFVGMDEWGVGVELQLKHTVIRNSDTWICWVQFFLMKHYYYPPPVNVNTLLDGVKKIPLESSFLPDLLLRKKNLHSHQQKNDTILHKPLVSSSDFGKNSLQLHVHRCLYVLVHMSKVACWICFNKQRRKVHARREKLCSFL